MQLFQEADFYSMSGENKDHIVAVTRLTNGVVVLIRANGTGIGTDGHTWAHVCRQLGEDEYEELGWTPDQTTPITLRESDEVTTGAYPD